jgi:hypothetical protein
MILNKSSKERIIETHLRHYNTYKIGMKNLQRQLDYIMPSLVSGYGSDGSHSFFYIGNNTERVALDRIESKKAIDLREEIERYRLITESIELVKDAMDYAEVKSIYRIRRHVLDKLMISLNNLLTLK